MINTRFAIGPTWESRGGFGGALSWTFAFARRVPRPAPEEKPRLTDRFRHRERRADKPTHTLVGPQVGIEIGGESLAPHFQAGVRGGFDSASLLGQRRLALGAGAQLTLMVGVPPVSFVGRATTHFDLGGRIERALFGLCREDYLYLGAGMEGGAQFGDPVAPSGFVALMLVVRELGGGIFGCI